MNDREADAKAYDDYRGRVGEVAGLDIWRAALAHARQQSGDHVMVPREPPSDPGPNYRAGLWSRRNWEAALEDMLAAAPARQEPPRIPTSCGYCTYEEADGELIEQCPRCKAADAQQEPPPLCIGCQQPEHCKKNGCIDKAVAQQEPPQQSAEPVRLGALLDEYLRAGHEAYTLGRETQRVADARVAIVKAFRAQQSAEPVAWERAWSRNGETPKKERNANGRMVWPVKFKFLPVTKVKVFADDYPLYR